MLMRNGVYSFPYGFVKERHVVLARLALAHPCAPSQMEPISPLTPELVQRPHIRGSPGNPAATRTNGTLAMDFRGNEVDGAYQPVRLKNGPFL
jgi:hypothetical protein